ncbi:hypothetical protein FA13DRAFT_1803469 [Coprinellus micaceus]|uniref:Uncharacterized protein n=1 Tax=Coprinellus micaceus TaxID=71717 RepID=A0A4Y7SAD6_COPMI|nr:hypothetical protein FA13DRAFT_1803469 [Coprinellus micaceus]
MLRREWDGRSPSSMHAQPHFLNNNSNPDILKARGRSFNDDGVVERWDEATSEQGEAGFWRARDAVEARERLEEAVKLLERAREVWRKDVWAPRRKARESAKRKKGRVRERERQEQELREKERKEREEKEREKVERAQVEMQKTKAKDNRLGKVKRRGIGKIAAGNKRAAAAAISPPSSSASSTSRPVPRGKSNEVASTMRALQSPNTEAPPVSPEPSGSEAATTSPPAMTDYFPLTPAPAVTAPDTFNTNTLDEEEEEERALAAEEGEEMEEVDLASLLAEALVMLAELQVEKGSKESMYRRARDEAGRAGKAGLVEEELGEEMNVDS